MSTSTYTISQVLDHSRRMAALNATTDATATWFNEQRAHLPFDDREWSTIFDELPEHHREASSRAYYDAYEATHQVTIELLEIVDRMRGWKLAWSRDRQQLAAVRCLVVDSDTDLRHGDLHAAHRGLQYAVTGLAAMRDKERNSPRSHRVLPVEIVDDITLTIDQLTILADRLGRAA